jgi:general secretion pathway protein E
MNLAASAPEQSALPRTALIGELLVAEGKATEADVAQALAFQAAHGGRLGAILVRMGALSEEALLPVLSRQLGFALFDPEEFPIEQLDPQGPDAAWMGAWMREHRVLLWRDADGALQAAAGDPLDVALADALSERLPGQPVAWRLSREQDVERILAALGRRDGAGLLDAAALRELAEDAPVIALVNGLIAEAIDERASDIHVEPGDLLFDIRFRVDGVLHSRHRLPMAKYPAVSSRIKLIAALDIAERRLPQDGRVSIRAAGQDLDIRVSVIPEVRGESIVLRLLRKHRSDMKLEELGIAPDHLAELEGWLEHPNGLVLVTGPTGSGKSTTLYAALAAANDLTRKIVTVEDPVEYRLPHVVQIQVQADIGYTFARALRSILRHDPDIILVGEIRDRETAEIAIQAALTGHLVLATLHTNDALAAIPRLTDMGVEPYLVAASLRALMAQRLVRRVCEQCAADAAPERFALEEWQKLAPRLAPGIAPSPPRWRKAVGCERCRNTGYRGRLAIHELVTADPDLLHAVAAGAPAAEIAALAERHGRRTLREDGLLKAALGHTTWDEVVRVVGGSGES